LGIGNVDCIKLLLPKTAKGINVPGSRMITPLICAAMSGKAAAVEELLRNGADANTAAENGSVPLHFAAQAGAVECIKILLPKTNSGVDVVGGLKMTPLAFAAREGKMAAVQELLKAGADANIADVKGDLPLHLSAEAGDVGSIKLLLPNTTQGVNVLGDKQFTSLTLAAMAGKAAAVEELLWVGADANIAAANGSLPLHFAAQAGDVKSIMMLLPLTTDGVNVLGEDNATPLAFAAMTGKTVAVQELLKAGADANIADIYGDVPLHIAAKAGDVDSIKLLLPNTTKGVNVLGDNKFTPLTFAATSGKAKAIEELLRLGADANIAAVNGSLPLHFAAQAGTAESIKLLLPKTANGVNALGENSSTPLAFAALAGKSKAIQVLFNEGADANIADKNGILPLHTAAAAVDIESIKLLLPKTAKGVDALDADGQTPLFFAFFDKTANFDKLLDVVTFLMDKEANPNIKNNIGESPLSFAKLKPGLSKIVKILENV